MNSVPVMQLIHFLICITLVFVCICRLNDDVCRQFKAARMRAVLVLSAALLSGCQLLVFGTRATPSESILAGAVLLSMFINSGYWTRAYNSKDGNA